MIYFKHHSNMRHDIKLKRVIAKYGLEGYGLYCLVIESITESLEENSPIPDLQENCEDIAEFYNGNTAKINEIMNYMINQGLFDLEDSGAIICHKVYKFLDTSQTRSEKLRNMIKSYKESLKAVSQNVSDKYERLDKIRLDKEEDKIRLEQEGKKDISLDSIIQYWNGKGNLKKAYSSMNQKEPGKLLNAIIEIGQDYVIEAIDNLSQNIENIAIMFRPRFEKFILESISHWHDYKPEKTEDNGYDGMTKEEWLKKVTEGINDEQ